MVSLGIDVGATSTRVALINDEGDILGSHRSSTSKLSDPSAWTSWLVQEIQNLIDVQAGGSSKVGAIGLALPCLMDVEAKVVQRSVNLPWLEQYPIAKEIEKRLGFACFFLTDADATTWGEYSAIESSDVPNRFVHLRFGTGIACGLVVDDAIQQLAPERTQHLDFLVCEKSPNALHCKCGLYGCLETIASGAAISRLTNQANLGDTINALRIAYETNSRTAADIVNRIQQAIEIVLDKIVARQSPDTIVIGGGVVDRFPALFDPLLNHSNRSPALANSISEIGQRRHNSPEPRALARAVSQDSTMSPEEKLITNTIVKKSAQGDWVGAIGAALLAKSPLAQQPS